MTCSEVYAKETASYYTFVREEDGSHNYKCSSCIKVYKAVANVVQHYRHVHLKLRPKLRSCYQCEVRVPGYLRAFHMEKEHGIPAPTCGACGKKFSYPFQVLRHQKNYHMGERKFTCESCDKTFTSRANLSQHQMTHSSVRPFKCDYCEKSFKWKKHLKTHLMIHLDVKRHVCTVCQEAFVQHTSLKYHIIRRHPDCDSLF